MSTCCSSATHHRNPQCGVEGHPSPPFQLDWPDKDIVQHYRSKTNDPPLLSACHESREVGLRIYKKVLSVQLLNGGIYMDFKHDTIFTTPGTLCLVLPHNTFRDPDYRYRLGRFIHSVAFDARQFVEMQDGQELPSEAKIGFAIRACIQGPRMLKELILVLNGDGTSVREEQLAMIHVHTPIPGTDVATLLRHIVSVFERRVITIFPSMPSPGRGVYKHGQKQYIPPKVRAMGMYEAKSEHLTCMLPTTANDNPLAKPPSHLIRLELESNGIQSPFTT
ncbi:hypothetical protein IFR05_007766 [Cadophora sp. M221]|nr:hypothetical protein IFR05_007766 [Cadophora sp. M221]